MPKSVFISLLMTMGFCAGGFAGTEWKARTVSTVDGSETKITVLVQAQGTTVREDIVEASGSGSDPYAKKDNWFLFETRTRTITVVNPGEKTATTMDLEKLMNSLGGVVSVKISNPKVSVKEMGKEAVLGYNCRRVQIVSSYDIETKIAFMTTKNHVEMTQDYWGAESADAFDISSFYIEKGLKTPYADLNTLINAQMKTLKGMGLIMKSTMTQKSYDISSPDKKQNITTVMTIESIQKKDIPADRFKIPAGYEVSDLNAAPPAQPKTTDKAKGSAPAGTQTEDTEEEAEPETKPEVDVNKLLKQFF